MYRFIYFLFFISSALTLACCQREPVVNPKPDKALFDSIPFSVVIQPIISEASGIADSKKNQGYLWVQEDGGNPTQLYLLKHDGAVQKKIYISGVSNRDWEDMVLSGADIYLGEIGDNNGVYQEYAFYKFPEPLVTTDTINTVETIRFRYADGAHDAEAFLVDPADKAIYIITKRDSHSKVYKLVPPFAASSVHIAEAVGQLSYSGVVGAAISSDRKEIIVKTYFGLTYYKVENSESIVTALSKTPITIPYIAEPQGEAVCFSNANHGYFTLSEKGGAAEVKLYFYRRN